MAISRKGPERREHPRVKQPVDGVWDGASGNSHVRISDISLSGCFVHTRATPRIGEVTRVTIAPPDRTAIVASGTVVYTENGMGFGMKFESLSEREAKELSALVDVLA